MLFYSSESDYARGFKILFPNCTVIIRDWPDDNVHHRETPIQWLAKRKHLADGGIYLYTTNEPGLDDSLIKWHLELMDLCIQYNVRLVILNFGVGNPGGSDWERLRPIIDKANQYRNLFIIGLHEYAGAVITSGLYGGYPDNAGVVPDSGKIGVNLVPVESWPMDVSNITCFHMGRYKFLIDYCKANKLPIPRIIVTEWGFDSTEDIGKWLDTLVKTPPNTDVNGWHTLANQWKAWWKQWTDPQDAYYYQIKWAENVLYKHVEALLIFGWTNERKWMGYDVSKSKTLHTRIESTSNPIDIPGDTPTEPSPPTIPPPTPPTPILDKFFHDKPPVPENKKSVLTFINWLLGLLAAVRDFIDDSN